MPHLQGGNHWGRSPDPLPGTGRIQGQFPLHSPAVIGFPSGSVSGHGGNPTWKEPDKSYKASTPLIRIIDAATGPWCRQGAWAAVPTADCPPAPASQGATSPRDMLVSATISPFKAVSPGRRMINTRAAGPARAAGQAGGARHHVCKTPRRNALAGSSAGKSVIQYTKVAGSSSRQGAYRKQPLNT